MPDERYDPAIYWIQLGWSWTSKTIKYLKSNFLNHFLREGWEGPLALFLEWKIARQVCFSRSSSKILLALDSCEVKVVDSFAGDVICRCKGGKHHITSASFSPVPWLPFHCDMLWLFFLKLWGKELGLKGGWTCLKSHLAFGVSFMRSLWWKARGTRMGVKF